ncbi:hypothetical protein FDENT_6742 [Fusarium denticulatum]|uniref:Uncharacterized protein n=1 Tax=Fusarium denticulatum TaxID=48507 RepID=A0A8H5X7P9_9HYPO|nr:hypothetical protein FDENT_6742 [Fusarium denticulatum]
MAPSGAIKAENEPGSYSPTESVSSGVSANGEVTIRNVGRRSLAQEIEDCLERENKNHNEDAQTVAEVSIEHALLNWFLGREVEVGGFPSEMTIAEL